MGVIIVILFPMAILNKRCMHNNINVYRYVVPEIRPPINCHWQRKISGGCNWGTQV